MDRLKPFINAMPQFNILNNRDNWYARTTKSFKFD